MKFTAKFDRVYDKNTVVGHDIPRCILWDGEHGVHTSIVRMHKGMDLGLHKHETWVQVFVLSGKLYCSHGKLTCLPGDYYFVEPGEAHVEIALEDSEIMIIKAHPNIQYPVERQEPSNIAALRQVINAKQVDR
ncbi:cupin domain-containing protein [Alcaligenes faecalis]|uniref:cupin domain-containing protein n=1 Tax=Alcaligenes faecalis TaxID=511 RepID=UPI001932D9B8|nr:cupin domain-containing protein [Alcaligenes faecalis]